MSTFGTCNYIPVLFTLSIEIFLNRPIYRTDTNRDVFSEVVQAIYLHQSHVWSMEYLIDVLIRLLRNVKGLVRRKNQAIHSLIDFSSMCRMIFIFGPYSHSNLLIKHDKIIRYFHLFYATCSSPNHVIAVDLNVSLQ